MASRFVRLSSALLLLPGLAGCSGADPSADVSAATASPSSAAPSSSGSATSSSSASAVDGRLAGEGYSFALPPGWDDATEQFQEYSELIDAGAVNAEQAGLPFSDNVNVLRNADQDRLPPAQAEHQFVEELRTVASRVRVLPSTEVDGVEVLHLSGRTKAGEVTALTDQYIAFVRGVYYVVTFSYGAATPPTRRDREVRSMLASWAWG